MRKTAIGVIDEWNPRQSLEIQQLRKQLKDEREGAISVRSDYDDPPFPNQAGFSPRTQVPRYLNPIPQPPPQPRKAINNIMVDKLKKLVEQLEGEKERIMLDWHKERGVLNYKLSASEEEVQRLQNEIRVLNRQNLLKERSLLQLDSKLEQELSTKKLDFSENASSLKLQVQEMSHEISQLRRDLKQKERQTAELTETLEKERDSAATEKKRWQSAFDAVQQERDSLMKKNRYFKEQLRARDINEGVLGTAASAFGGGPSVPVSNPSQSLPTNKKSDLLVSASVPLFFLQVLRAKEQQIHRLQLENQFLAESWMTLRNQVQGEGGDLLIPDTDRRMMNSAQTDQGNLSPEPTGPSYTDNDLVDDELEQFAKLGEDQGDDGQPQTDDDLKPGSRSHPEPSGLTGTAPNMASHSQASSGGVLLSGPSVRASSAPTDPAAPGANTSNGPTKVNQGAEEAGREVTPSWRANWRGRSEAWHETKEEKEGAKAPAKSHIRLVEMADAHDDTGRDSPTDEYADPFAGQELPDPNLPLKESLTITELKREIKNLSLCLDAIHRHVAEVDQYRTDLEQLVSSQEKYIVRMREENSQVGAALDELLQCLDASPAPDVQQLLVTIQSRISVSPLDFALDSRNQALLEQVRDFEQLLETLLLSQTVPKPASLLNPLKPVADKREHNHNLLRRMTQLKADIRAVVLHAKHKGEEISRREENLRKEEEERESENYISPAAEKQIEKLQQELRFAREQLETLEQSQPSAAKASAATQSKEKVLSDVCVDAEGVSQLSQMQTLVYNIQDKIRAILKKKNKMFLLRST
eukprot:TRINITY_DN10659_c0_g1_i3.p1 TRINITY_DN10659_c0_g1~~TRINITY_DN10659_c0_g1_i3.p1  ORF type:complete len:811 (-),score=162.54 TRINITY_DN10659_c0_g1_i3:37-2469(-)